MAIPVYWESQLLSREERGAGTREERGAGTREELGLPIAKDTSWLVDRSFWQSWE